MSSIVRAISPEVPEPAPGTWSNCLVVNGIAYLAGMTARGAGLGDEYTQSKAIFTKIRHLVEAAGGSMADIVKVTIFVTDIRDMGAVSKALGKALKGSVVTSTLVAVSALAVPGLVVEIESVGVVGT